MSGKEICIIYFSATGNTKYAAKELQKNLQANDYNVQIISAEDIDLIKSLDLSNKVLGIGFPCYAFSYPNMVIDRAIDSVKIDKLPKTAFIFSTFCIGSGLSNYDLSCKLKHKGIKITSIGGFKCPSSGFVNLKSGKEKGIKKIFFDFVTSFSSSLSQQIHQFTYKTVDAIEQNKVIIIKKPIFIQYLPRKIAEFNEKRIFHSYEIDRKRCNNCGICVKNCPIGNIKIIDGDVKFVDANNCLRCMRCISNCSNNAITLGEKTKGKMRYSSKLRKELLNAAENKK